VDDELTRRVVDFASGLIYALDGTMSRVGTGLVLVLPPSTRIDSDEKRRLASLGAYELPVE
jgi:cell division inhibitor SepF